MLVAYMAEDKDAGEDYTCFFYCHNCNGLAQGCCNETTQSK